MNNAEHIFQGFYEYCNGVKKLKHSSVKDIRCSVNKMRKFLYKEGIDDEIWEVELEIFIRYFQTLRKKGERGTGISKQMSHLRSLIDYCWRLEHCSKNVLNGFSIKDKDPVYMPRYLTIPETTKLLRACKKGTRLERKKRLVILILYGLGLRTSELINIKVKNIDVEKQELFVCGKFDIERRIPIPDGVWIELLAYLHENNLKRGHLFRTEVRKTKLSIAEIGDLVKELARNAELDSGITPKTLRHTFASHLMDQGVDIAIISSLMGHKSPRETGVYLHAFKARKEEAINSVEPLLEGDE